MYSYIKLLYPVSVSATPFPGGLLQGPEDVLVFLGTCAGLSEPLLYMVILIAACLVFIIGAGKALNFCYFFELLLTTQNHYGEMYGYIN